MARRRRPPPKREQVVVDACGCDCCARALGPGRAQSDGYCPFCADRCFPAASTASGAYTRVAFDRPSRARLHAAYDAGDPADAPSAPAAPGASPVQHALEQAADMLGRAARPHVDRLVRQGLRRLFK